MNSYKNDDSGKVSVFKILFFALLIFIPVIGWLILFCWIVGDAKKHNQMIDKHNNEIKKIIETNSTNEENSNKKKKTVK
ncbi:MAG: hypothetical protein LBB95_01065 [Mycoplasmataceae bacterium]|nr:hypothetical protein [Mycoplasmataceae bacterium]